MRWPRQLMSLLFVLVLLTGPPLVLLVLVGPPIRGWPTGEQARAWVQQPLTEQTLTAALTIGAWLVWLMLAYTVAVRVLLRARATSVWLRRLPLPTPLQATASGMAGAAVLGVTTNTVTAAPPPPPQPVAADATALHDEATPPGGGGGGQSASDGGIGVPGGWLPHDVAVQVAAAAALVWLRRRRDYHPQPISPDGRHDPDLAPLPPTVAGVQAALADSPGPSAPPSGIAALVEALPAGGVGLTGPGALAVGRGLLVTALLTGQHHQARPQLITTRATLSNLLGPAAETLGRRLPLTTVDSIADAVQLVAPGGSCAAVNTADQHQDTQGASTHPRIVLLSEPDGDGHDLRRLADASATAVAVVLGGSLAGPAWHADPAGHLHGPHRPDAPGPQLCVLDQVAATDLLAVIAGPDPTPHPTAPSPPGPVAVSPQRRLPRQATRHQPRRMSPALGHRLRLRVLGDPELLIDGEPVAVRRSAALHVLVYLAAHPAGADTGQLTDAIWPGLPRHSLSGRLYTTLSDLRATIRTASGLHVIDHTDDRYRLHPEHIDVDLWHLNTAIRHAATAINDTRSAWQAILDAYPADLATGRIWPWLDPIRETIRRNIIDVCVCFAAAEPDPHHALTLLQDGIRIDPYNTDLHTHAMHALTALGDSEAAAELHHRYQRTLTHAGLDGGALHRPPVVSPNGPEHV
ncbi:BTAD domain-containing putative transcriptional regulator [Micromonospora sp. WMMD1082]|uniref:AfsR/SARP family transcriptional regulator n=1 Tax=Micromonospora sp. WMMD1082 TaxID=3016104 RepID=UPI00241715EE|nr:BTAD domain-containing putative transcriptional regulator [Micromonospora sp. WMMD1082]MDG4793494.1 BTAD domain-containing putative transcriptional regulator [Micromonospora sp. WMMD1082]